MASSGQASESPAQSASSSSCQLIIKNPQKTEGFTLDMALDASIAELQGRLAEVYPGKPPASEQTVSARHGRTSYPPPRWSQALETLFSPTLETHHFVDGAYSCCLHPPAAYICRPCAEGQGNDPEGCCGQGTVLMGCS